MAVLEDTFAVTAVDPDGKIFDRVSRIVATSEGYGMALTLDINCELFPLKTGQKFSFMLSKSLDPEAAKASGAASSGPVAYKPNAGPSLADRYDYVMFGKVYKLESLSTDKMALYVSFGGLLLRVEANPRYLTEVTNGSNLYLLLKKL